MCHLGNILKSINEYISFRAQKSTWMDGRTQTEVTTTSISRSPEVSPTKTVFERVKDIMGEGEKILVTVFAPFSKLFSKVSFLNAAEANYYATKGPCLTLS